MTSTLFKSPSRSLTLPMRPTFVSVAAVVAVLLLLPAAQAGTASWAAPAGSFGPPYHHTKTFYQTVYTIAEKRATCLNTSVGDTLFVKPRANASTGRVASENLLVAHAGGTRCVVTEYLTTTAGFIGPPFRAANSGNHTISYGWNLSWAANGTGSKHSTSVVQIDLFGNVLDTTTNQSVLIYDATTVAVSLSCTNATGICNPSSQSGSQAFTVSFNCTLNATDTYRFVAGVETMAAVHAPSSLFHTTSASALIDVGSTGRGAWLLSMSVS